MAVVRMMTGLWLWCMPMGGCRIAHGHGAWDIPHDGGGSKRSMAVSGPEWHMAMDPMTIRDMGVDVCHSHTRIAMRCPIGYTHARA